MDQVRISADKAKGKERKGVREREEREEEVRGMNEPPSARSTYEKRIDCRNSKK